MNATRTLQTTTHALGDDGSVEAVVSAFGVVDSFGTRATRSFWEASLARRASPKIVWGGHDWTRPIGSVTGHEILAPGDERLPEMARAGGGLLIRGRLNLGTDDGRNAYALLKAGDIEEWSFGATDVEFARNEADKVLDFVGGDVREVSPVLVGSNPGTRTVSVRAAESGERLEDHAARVLAEMDLLAARIAAVSELRGRLSPSNRARLAPLASLAASLLSLCPLDGSPAPDAALDPIPVADGPMPLPATSRAGAKRAALKALTDPQNLP